MSLDPAVQVGASVDKEAKEGAAEHEVPIARRMAMRRRVAISVITQKMMVVILQARKGRFANLQSREQ